MVLIIYRYATQQNSMKTQTYIHITMGKFFFDKESKRNNGKKKTSLKTVAGIPGYLYVEKCTQIHIYFPSQTSSPSRLKTSK